MVAAVLLWIATAALYGGLLLDRADTSYEVGRAMGTALGGLLLAALLRLVYVRLTPWGKGKPEIAPAFFVLAAAVTLLGIGGRHLADADEVSDYVAAADRCAGQHPSPLTTAPAGLALAPLASAQQAEFDRIAAESMPAELAERIELKQIAVQGRVAGVGVTVPGMTGPQRGQFEAGLAAGAGGASEPTTIGGGRGLRITTPSVTAIAGYPSCWALVVFAPDPDTARSLAESLARS